MVTNELLIKKIKEQINEAEQLSSEPVLFKEALKRIEILCELVTEEKTELKSITKVTPEMLESTNQKPLNHSIETSNKQTDSDLSSNSIFDF